MISLKWLKTAFLNAKNHTIEFDKSIDVDKSLFQEKHQIKALKEIVAFGKMRYDLNEDLIHVDITVEGVMVVPCSLTLEDVEYEFTTDAYELFSFTKNKQEMDIHYCEKHQIDLIPLIVQLISMEVPMRIVKDEILQYPSGQDWEITSDELYSKKEKPIDPRLAKLKEYQFKK